MILTLELQDGEKLPADFARYLIGSGQQFEKRYKEVVPPIELRLVRAGERFRMEGGYWMPDDRRGEA